MCWTVINSSGQRGQGGGVWRLRMRYEWLRRVCPIRRRARTTSYRLLGRVEVGQKVGFDLICLSVLNDGARFSQFWIHSGAMRE